MTSRMNSSLSMYESSYSVRPGSDTLATDDLFLPGAYPSSPSDEEAVEEPFVNGCEKPLLLTRDLWPLDGPTAEDGPASRCESRETERAESLSLSVSLMAG